MSIIPKHDSITLNRDFFNPTELRLNQRRGEFYSLTKVFFVTAFFAFECAVITAPPLGNNFFEDCIDLYPNSQYVLGYILQTIKLS